MADAEGFVVYANNQYSVPWQLVGETLPLRVTETELFVYDRRIQERARHRLFHGQTGQHRIDPAHRPPPDARLQVEVLRQRFGELGEIASRFLEGLLKKQRYGKHQANRVLALLNAYHHQDLLSAMQRAVRYHAYSVSSLERILNIQAQPKSFWLTLSDDQQRTLQALTEADSIQPRPSAEYQSLLFEENDSDDPEKNQRRESPPTDPGLSEDA